MQAKINNALQTQANTKGRRIPNPQPPPSKQSIFLVTIHNSPETTADPKTAGGRAASATTHFPLYHGRSKAAVVPAFPHPNRHRPSPDPAARSFVFSYDTQRKMISKCMIQEPIITGGQQALHSKIFLVNRLQYVL